MKPKGELKGGEWFFLGGWGEFGSDRVFGPSAEQIWRGSEGVGEVRGQGVGGLVVFLLQRQEGVKQNLHLAVEWHTVLEWYRPTKKEEKNQRILLMTIGQSPRDRQISTSQEVREPRWRVLRGEGSGAGRGGDGKCFPSQLQSRRAVF